MQGAGRIKKMYYIGPTAIYWSLILGMGASNFVA